MDILVPEATHHTYRLFFVAQEITYIATAVMKTQGIGVIKFDEMWPAKDFNNHFKEIFHFPTLSTLPVSNKVDVSSSQDLSSPLIRCQAMSEPLGPAAMASGISCCVDIVSAWVLKNLAVPVDVSARDLETVRK